MALDVKKVLIGQDGSTELDLPVELQLEGKHIKLDDSDFVAGDMTDGLKEIDFRQIIKEPTGFLDIDETTLSFDNGNRRVTITPVGASFTYYIRGVEYVKTGAEYVDITDTDGVHFIYYSGSTLTTSTTPWDFTDQIAFVAYVVWDATNDKFIIKGEERHGCTMDWATHKRLHYVQRTQAERFDFERGNYTLFGDGSLDSHAQISYENGTLHDEDIIMPVTNSATPTGSWEQKLSTIAYIPLYYKTGSGDGVWRKQDATAFPVVYDGVNPIKYNKYDAGTWSLESITNGYYVQTWIIATNNINEPIIGVVGRVQSETLLVPESESGYEGLDDILSDLPFQEFYPMDKLFFKSDTAYTNTPLASLQRAIVIREEKVDSDRYNFVAVYNGNAGINRYLEFFPNIGSDEAPFDFPEDSFIRTITAGTNASSTGVITFYKVGTPDTAVFTVTFTAETYKKINTAIFFDEDDQIYAKVTSGSFSKPRLRVFVQSDL